MEQIVALARKITSHPLILMLIGLGWVIGALALASEISVKLIGAFGRSDAVELLSSAIAGLLALAAYALFRRYVERRGMGDLALGGAQGSAWHEWGYGVLIGFGVMSVTVGVIAALGGYRISGTNALSVLIPMIGIAIISGVSEEILLRGLIFRCVERWLGSWVALGFSALLFGALHLANPNATLLAAFAIALEAGILLGALYMVTRRLWGVIGLHMAWNFTQGGIYGFAVSGLDLKGVIIPKIEGPDLLTGGAFGAEASLPAILLCTLVGLYFVRKAVTLGHIVAPSWSRFKTGEENAEGAPE